MSHATGTAYQNPAGTRAAAERLLARQRELMAAGRSYDEARRFAATENPDLERAASGVTGPAPASPDGGVERLAQLVAGGVDYVTAFRQVAREREERFRQPTPPAGGMRRLRYGS